MKTRYYYCDNSSLLLLGSLNGYGLFYTFPRKTSSRHIIFHQHSSCHWKSKQTPNHTERKSLSQYLGSTLGIHRSKTTQRICLFSKDLLVYLKALMWSQLYSSFFAFRNSRRIEVKRVLKKKRRKSVNPARSPVFFPTFLLETNKIAGNNHCDYNPLLRLFIQAPWRPQARLALNCMSTESPEEW